jgi:phosphoadenosine phosphosulfate reductase
LDLPASAAALEGAAPQAVVRWALETFRGRVALACSFGGPTGLAIIDIVMRVDSRTPVYYLDTGLLFPQTHDLIARVERRYGIVPRAVAPSLSLAEQAERFGEALWARDPDRCCALRKVEPQRAFLREYDAWITGLRRDQAPTRNATPVAAWDDEFGLVKISPFATWTESDVWRYIADQRLSVNALHAEGYASIGCMPCTRPIRPGEDLRAGRWSDSGKIECGLHARKPGTGSAAS